MLKGPTNSGKTQFAFSTIEVYLKENQEHRVVYVGLTHNSGTKLLNQLDEASKSRVACFGIDTLQKDLAISDAEFVLAPHAGLKLADTCEKVLIVFDDVLLQQFKERSVYALANQPFADQQILNHLMESTGCYKDGREVTSMMLFDTQANTLQFQKDEDSLVAHAESIADHIIEFNNE